MAHLAVDAAAIMEATARRNAEAERIESLLPSGKVVSIIQRRTKRTRVPTACRTIQVTPENQIGFASSEGAQCMS
ncbi:hypothetical protein NS226_15600 [Aureimonas ureilytica]|uniref:Uncharacterized protein n=1 Tax=Aureimonas ureilytica TaxID=401562 RepID=A0A175R5E6_9HYPH|nr:hypothetical protein NS226_15600 [Aureimonas ureilytica]